MDQEADGLESFSAEAVADVVQGAERLAREQVARVIADRFRQIEPAVRTRLDKEYERSTRARVEAARREANREFSEQISRCVGRMREDGESWGEAVLDATVGLCRIAILLGVRDGRLSLTGARGGVPGEFGGAEVGNGSALASVVNEGRTGFASRDDLPAELAGLLGRASDGRIALVPVTVGGEVRSLLCAEGVADLGAVEMIAEIAGSMLQARLAEIAAARAAVLPAEIAAKRFARMAVSRVVLEQFATLQRGRADRAVYRSLREAIDAARAEYRGAHFAAIGRDWLHDEIVRSLAGGQVELLGPDYPGPIA